MYAIRYVYVSNVACSMAIPGPCNIMPWNALKTVSRKLLLVNILFFVCVHVRSTNHSTSNKKTSAEQQQQQQKIDK